MTVHKALTRSLTRKEFDEETQHLKTKIILPDGTRMSKGKYMTRKGFDYDAMFEDLTYVFTIRFAERPTMPSNLNNKLYTLLADDVNEEYNTSRWKGLVKLELREGSARLIQNQNQSVNVDPMTAWSWIIHLFRNKRVYKVEDLGI